MGMKAEQQPEVMPVEVVSCYSMVKSIDCTESSILLGAHIFHFHALSGWRPIAEKRVKNR